MGFLAEEGFVRNLFLHEQFLLPANVEELLVLSLEETNTNGQVDGHDPEFRLTREKAVERVDNEYSSDVDMENPERR